MYMRIFMHTLCWGAQNNVARNMNHGISLMVHFARTLSKRNGTALCVF